jgi:uncharacterized protein (DUF885 family)
MNSLFRLSFVIIFLLAIQNITLAEADLKQDDTDAAYDELVELYDSFRDFRFPEVNNGVPDYTADAMAKRAEELKTYQENLASIDTTGWEIPKQVDYHIVQAEMNALEFRHRVTRPWSRDPAFYAVITFQFGPKMHRSVNVPDVPMSEERKKEFRTELEAIPKILQQARNNLTEPKADLAYIGIHTKNREAEVLEELIPELEKEHPDLVAAAESALESIEDFRSWLEETRPEMENDSGVGVENYNWYLRNVAMLPYTLDELLVLAKKEYEHAIANMKLKEYGNRHTPVLEPVDNREDYLERYNSAMKHMYDFLHKQELFTVPDYFEAPEPADSYSRSEERDYFQNVLDRYPLPLSAHGFVGHDQDAQRYDRDDRPIRGESRLFYITGARAEALATAFEGFLSQIGLIDDVPRAEELLYNLKAFRAIRAVTDLRMHANEITFEEAFEYNNEYTPYNWAPDNSPTLWHDLELYMRKPLYGVGYVIGPILIERLMAEKFWQEEENFNVKKFMDQFMETGFMPISLIRWEMTGRKPFETEPPYWD